MADVHFVEGYVVEAPDSDPQGFGDYIILNVDSRQLYYWPREVRLKGPSREELDACTSNTQRRALLEPWFEIGQRVQCRVINEARGIVGSLRKLGNVQEEYKSHHGVLSFKAVCIVTDSEPRECTAIPLGPVEVDQEYLKEAMPHVPFNGYIVFDIDRYALQCRFRLDHVDTDEPVAPDMLDYAGSAPWYTRGLESVAVDAEEDDEVPEEVARWRAATEKDYRPREKIEGRGFFVSMREVFCNAVKLWPVRIAWVDPLYRKELWAGRLINFKAYFCHHNGCYVVYNWREFDWPIQTLPSGQNAVDGNEGAIIKAGLDSTGIAGIFLNAHVGYVFDAAGVIDGLEARSGQPIYAYIEHCFSAEFYKFRVHSLAIEHHPQGLRALPVEFRGKAYVTGLTGQLYAAELYAYKCLLPLEMHNRFQPGQVVRISATCNAASGTFEVSEAESVDGEQVPAMVNRRTRVVALRPRVRCSTHHPMFFEHPDFGPIRSVDATDISVARVKKIRPVIKIVDDFDDSPDPRYRFKCIAIEPDGFR